MGKSPAPEEPETATTVESCGVERDGIAPNDTQSPPPACYEVANFPVPNDKDIGDLPTATLAGVVDAVIKVEGPIHRQELARRVTQLWGLKRTGRKISEAVDKAVQLLLHNRQLKIVDDFLSDQSQVDVVIRNRSDAPASVRKPDMIPTEEISAAVLQFVGQYFGIQREEVLSATRDAIGLTNLSSPLRNRIDEVIEMLITSGVIQDREGCLYRIESESHAS